MKKLFEQHQDVATGDVCVSICIPYIATLNHFPSDFEKQIIKIANKTRKTSDYLMALSEWFLVYEENLEVNKETK